MENSQLRIGNLVNVPPEVTGHDTYVLGCIADLEYFMDYTLATVNFIRPYKLKGNRSTVCMADKLSPVPEKK